MIVHHAKQTLITHFERPQGLGVKCAHNIGGRMLRILPVQEIGQNQHEKGGGLIIRHGRIIRILRYYQRDMYGRLHVT